METSPDPKPSAICAEPIQSNHNVALVSVLLWLPGNNHSDAPPSGQPALAIGTAVLRGADTVEGPSRRSGRHPVGDVSSARSKGELRRILKMRRNVLS